MNKFTFGMNICKAYEQDGRWLVDAKVSDTRLDYQKQRMNPRALDSMLKFLKDGFIAQDGTHQRVWLLPFHQASFKIGEAVNGRINKASDQELELVATFELDQNEPDAQKIYKSTQDGTNRHQLSVGGEGLGQLSYDQKLQKQVVELMDVKALEHVAVTRPHRSAVAAAGFLQPMMKSIEGGGTNNDDGVLRGMLYKESSEGDGWHMTPEQEATLLAGIETLTKSVETLTADVTVLKDKGASPITVTPAASSTLPVVKGIDAADPLLSNPEVQQFIAKQREANRIEAERDAFKTDVLKGVETLISPLVETVTKMAGKVGIPVPRTTQAVPPGAQEVQVQKGKEESGGSFVNQEEPSLLSKAIEVQKGKLEKLMAEGEEIKQKRAHGVEFKPEEQMRAQAVAKDIGSVTANIRYMEVTGNLIA